MKKCIYIIVCLLLYANMLINMYIALTFSLGIQVQIVPPAAVNEGPPTQIALICVQRVPGSSTLAPGVTATFLLSLDLLSQ